MRSSCLQFSTLVITGRRTDSAHSISVNRHSFYIQLSTSYPFIRLSGFTDTQHQCISLYFIRIKVYDAIQDLQEDAKDLAHHAKHKAEEVSSEVAGKVGEKVEEVKGKIHEAANK